MLSTTSSSIPYPESVDIPETNKHLQNVATAIDLLTVPRFATSAARSAGIPSPTNGQAAFLQDTEQLTHYKNGYSAWIPQDRPRVYKYKTADESVTNSVTFQDDNHLVGMTLRASTWYIFRGSLFFTADSAVAIKFIPVWTAAPSVNDSFWGMKWSRSTAGLFQATAVITAQIVCAVNTGRRHCAFVEGVALTPGTAPTVKLQWAQNTAGANPATLYAGSYLEFVEAF